MGGGGEGAVVSADQPETGSPWGGHPTKPHREPAPALGTLLSPVASLKCAEGREMLLSASKTPQE